MCLPSFDALVPRSRRAVMRDAVNRTRTRVTLELTLGTTARGAALAAASERLALVGCLVSLGLRSERPWLSGSQRLHTPCTHDSNAVSAEILNGRYNCKLTHRMLWHWPTLVAELPRKWAWVHAQVTCMRGIQLITGKDWRRPRPGGRAFPIHGCAGYHAGGPDAGAPRAAPQCRTPPAPQYRRLGGLPAPCAHRSATAKMPARLLPNAVESAAGGRRHGPMQDDNGQSPL